MNNIRDFIGTVNPDKLVMMLKAETLGNTEEYQKLKKQLMEEYEESLTD